MTVLRDLITVSTSFILVFSYNTLASTQELPSNSKNATQNQAVNQATPKPSQPNSPANSPTIAQENQRSEADLIKESTSPNQFINPNANPLLFPTKPSEVDIKIVQPITLEQAIEVAIKNNKDLQAARLTLDQSRAALDEALADQLPTVQTTLDLSYEDSASQEQSNIRIENVGGTTVTDTTGSTFNGQIELNYDVYTGGRRGALIKQREKQVRFNQLDLERIAQETRFTVSSNYYDLQSADAQVAIQQASVEDASQTLRDAVLLEQAGLGTRFDVLRAEVELANANQSLTTAISQQRQARRQLAETLSIGQQVELTAADQINEAGSWNLSLDESIVLAYKNRAELEQLLVQIEVNEQQREIELAAVRPQVQLFANYNVLDDLTDDIGVTDGYTFGTRLSWLFFDGGRTGARVEQSNREIDINQTNFGAQRDTIRLQVETAYFDLIANKENIKTAEKAVETATESLRLARLRFQAGVGTQTDVIDAQTELTTARGNVLTAIIGYNQSLNQLQRSVSNLPDNRLFELQ